MPFLTTYDLSHAPSLRHRLVAAIVTRAGLITQEARGNRTARHDQMRKALAVQVMAEPESMAHRFIWPVLSGATIATKGLDATDAELAAQVAAVWDAVAGVTPDDSTPPATT